MNLEEALRDLSAALASAAAGRRRNARFNAARHVLVRHCLAALGRDCPDELSLDVVIRLAAEAPAVSARRACAVLMVHALAVRGLVPAASAGEVCVLVESALRGALLRAGYPFGGSTEQKLQMLERLHRSIDELMQPLEPTFPNFQGLYAG